MQKTSKIKIKKILQMFPCTTAYGRYWSTENVHNNIVILLNNEILLKHAIHHFDRVYKNKLSYTTPNLWYEFPALLAR